MLHVVFGAGQIGTPLATLLRQRGFAVRLVRRSGPGPDGIEVRHGDAADAAFVADACANASVVYHCMNPVYSHGLWARVLPRWMDHLIVGAGRAGARLVVLDNVYAFGRLTGPLDESAPIAPVSRKGQVRAKVDAQLWAAHHRGDVRAVVGRGSDFYGPGAVASYFGDFFWPQALAGRPAEQPFDLDMPHTYHYTSDVVAGLAALGTGPDDTLGHWWMLPCAPAESSRVLVARFASALHRELRVRRMAGWKLSLGGLFSPLVRELKEMGYQWEAPFVMNDRRMRERFGLVATPLDEGARATAAWAASHYARPR